MQPRLVIDSVVYENVSTSFLKNSHEFIASSFVSLFAQHKAFFFSYLRYSMFI